MNAPRNWLPTVAALLARRTDLAGIGVTAAVEAVVSNV